MELRFAIDLGALIPDDVIVECLVGQASPKGAPEIVHAITRTLQARAGKDEIQFGLDLRPDLSGPQCYEIGVYPYHSRMTHPFEPGLMKWQ